MLYNIPEKQMSQQVMQLAIVNCFGQCDYEADWHIKWCDV